jgi:hypothetical protein
MRGESEARWKRPSKFRSPAGPVWDKRRTYSELRSQYLWVQYGQYGALCEGEVRAECEREQSAGGFSV